MKLFVGLVILSSVTFMSAQQTTHPEPARAAKIIADIATASSKIAVKNAPLSADEVNESVQTLADGNRIVRNSTGKIYRNSDGRTRREMSGGVGGMMGSLYSTGEGISLFNPVIGQKLALDTTLKTARVVELTPGQTIAITGTRSTTEEDTAKAVTELKIKMNGNFKVMAPLPPLKPFPDGFATTMTGSGPGGLTAFSAYSSHSNSNYESKSEDLGTRDFEGVSAQGTRKVTTIPAGAIGNERPIEIVYERWFSKDLGLVVYSKNSDPRFGEQTYKLTNLVRSEPDPSLFSLPTGYKVISTEPSSAYRAATRAYEVARAAAERAAVRGTPVLYKTRVNDVKPVPVNVVEKVKP